MLMAEPAVALRETARVLRPAGKLALSVWGDPGSNPWAAVPMREIAAHLSLPAPAPDAPGLWSLSDESRLNGELENAGFESVEVVALDGSAEFDSADHWIEMTRRLAGPLRTLWERLDESTRTAVEQLIREAAGPYEGSDGHLSVPERMLAASAVAPAASQ